MQFATRPQSQARLWDLFVNFFEQPKSDLPHRSGPRAEEEVPACHWSLPEVRIVVLYVVLASLWIVGSDLVLTESVTPDYKMGVLQSLKGLNFVITTGILLFLVLRRAYGGWRLAEERRLTVMRQARERYRNLSSRIQGLREEDRTKIAREIHDELGQLLTGIKMELRMAENHLSDRNDRSLNPVIDKLVEATEIVDTTISAVQKISAGLRPSALDHLGLQVALVEEADQFQERTGIPCTVEIQDPMAVVPPEVETAAFRIFQESLTNVARHSRAKKVEAAFSANNRLLKLLIRDDGIGMDVSVMEDPKSLGLIGMLERAENLGGSLMINSHPQTGTEVILSIPLPEKSTKTVLLT